MLRARLDDIFLVFIILKVDIYKPYCLSLWSDIER